MIERFSGAEGARRLVDALLQQGALQGDQQLAEALATEAEVLSFLRGATLITQDAADNDLYFILAGRFSVQVHGRVVAHREAGQHVGEMALIDPAARRSASLVAIEESVVARVSEAAFTRLSDRWPRLWRHLARELADRLRQRNVLVRPRNEISRLFIGSSAESLMIAQELQAGLQYGKVVVEVWTNRVFGASEFSLEALERMAAEIDFAALVFGPDDRVISRGHESDAPRDNVVFELGLFMGAIGRRRTFLVLPHGVDIKIPSDLLGITPLRYVHRPTNSAASLGPVCTELRRIVEERGPK